MLIINSFKTFLFNNYIKEAGYNDFFLKKRFKPLY